jgi:hypothetical protein
MNRQMFNQGGYVRPQRMNLGGQPMMTPAGPPMAPPPMEAEQALAGAEMQGQEMGMMAAEGVMQQIDGAQDYQSLIDGIRGNQQPLEARYAELGSIVGQQDAMQTPESVLALTQPAIMMTEEGAVNSGIGELMQGIAGDTSMEGQMGEGVGGLMMAQAPEPAMEAPMMEAGNTPPVNFRQGGPVEVQRLQAGGTPSAIDIAGRDLSKYQDFLSGGYDAQARAAELEEQRKMSQAQMLFDIAQAGLQFAGTTEGGSIAERLANAAAQTQLPQRIGERSAQMLAAKQAQTAEKRQLDMAARQAALQGGQAEVDYAQQLALANANRAATKGVYEELFRVNDEGVVTSLGKFNRSNEGDEARYQSLIADGAKTASIVDPLLKAREAKLSQLGELSAKVEAGTLPTKTMTFNTATTYEYNGKEFSVDAGQTEVMTEPEIQAARNAGASLFPFNKDATFMTYYSTNPLTPTKTKLVNTSIPTGQALIESAVFATNWTENPSAYDTAIAEASKLRVLEKTVGFDTEKATTLHRRTVELANLQFADNAKGRQLRQQIALDANALARELQQNDFVYGREEGQTQQGYKMELQNSAAEIDKRLLELKNTQENLSREDDQEARIALANLQADLRDRSEQIASALRLENALKQFNAKSLQEITMMNAGAARDIAYANHTAALGDASRRDQNVFVNQQRIFAVLDQKDLANVKSALTENRNLNSDMRAAAESVLDRAAAAGLQRNSLLSASTLQAARIESSEMLAGNKLAQQALDKALDRAAREKLQLDDQSWRKMMQDAADELGLNKQATQNLFEAGENTKDRLAREGLQLGSQEHATAMQARDIVATAARQTKGIEATALQGMLNRAAQETRLLTQVEATAALQDERLEFTGDQNDQDRAIEEFQNLVSNAATERGMDLTEARDNAAHARGVASNLLEQQRIDISKEKIDLEKIGVDADMLQRYGQNKTSDKETALVNGAIIVWNSPAGLRYDPSAKTYSDKDRRPLTPEMISALKARQALGLTDLPDVQFDGQLSPSGETQVLTDNVITETPYKKALTESDLAFGSDSFLQNLTNIFVEFISLDQVGGPFKQEKEAITAVKNLNNEFVLIFSAAQSETAARGGQSVYSQKDLKELVPVPASLFQGSGDAASKAGVLVSRIQGQIDGLNAALSRDDIPLTATGRGSKSSKEQLLPKLEKLKSAYSIIAGLRDVSGEGQQGSVTQDSVVDDVYDIISK